MGFLGDTSSKPNDIRRIQAIIESVYGDGVSAGRVRPMGGNIYSVLGEKIAVMTRDELPAGFAKKYRDHDIINGLYVFPAEQ